MDHDSDGTTGQLLEELFSSLEDLETQSAGVLQFLKDKGLASDSEIKPYLDAAAEASEVRWRAARLRMEALLWAAIADTKRELEQQIEEREKAAKGKKEERAEKAEEEKREDTDSRTSAGGETKSSPQGAEKKSSAEGERESETSGKSSAQGAEMNKEPEAQKKSDSEKKPEPPNENGSVQKTEADVQESIHSRDKSDDGSRDRDAGERKNEVNPPKKNAA